MRRSSWNNLLACVLLASSPFIVATAHAEDAYEDWMEADEALSATKNQKPENTAGTSTNNGRSYAQTRTAAPAAVRRFHEVLDELLAEFGYDVKMGQIKNLKNVAIRKVEVSRSIPNTYMSYIELSVQERIRENSQVRLISCLPCRSKTSRLVEGKLLISSPTTNLAQLNLAAEQLGIDSFMDIVLVYHTTHMVLAFQVFDAKSKETLWSRTYNSETAKSRYQKLAVDYRQVEKSRPGEDYVPEYRMMFGIGGAIVPNVGGGSDDKSMINLQLRGSEKFNNRRTEFGLIMSLMLATKSVLKSYPTQGIAPAGNDNEDTDNATVGLKPKPYTQALVLNAIYTHNFIGRLESYNDVRHGVHGGAGVFFATGYLAPTLRAGWDVYFGRRFVMTLGSLYVLPSKILIDGDFIKTKGGTGVEAVLSLNF